MAFSNSKKILLILILSIQTTFELSAQSDPQISQAIKLYEKGWNELVNKNFPAALTYFEQSYAIYHHSEIAYAISYSYFNKSNKPKTKKYANLAINGIPKLKNELITNANKLLSWAETTDGDMEANMDTSLPNVKGPSVSLSKYVLYGLYTIQQKSNNRYLDAHVTSDKDYSIVTRPRQNNDSQLWLIKPFGNNAYTIQQKSNNRYMDAHGSSDKDFALVTRLQQVTSSQHWIIKSVGINTYTIQQQSNNRFMDAHEYGEKDFSVVTRPLQPNNDTQKWIILKK